MTKLYPVMSLSRAHTIAQDGISPIGLDNAFYTPRRLDGRGIFGPVAVRVESATYNEAQHKRSITVALAMIVQMFPMLPDERLPDVSAHIHNCTTGNAISRARLTRDWLLG